MKSAVTTRRIISRIGSGPDGSITPEAASSARHGQACTARAPCTAFETEFGSLNLQFAWEEKQVVDEVQQEAILSSRGIMTVNEAGRLGSMCLANSSAMTRLNS